jgi:transposase
MTRTNSGAGKRKNSGVGFKARGALEAIPGEMTVAELVSRHGVYQTLIDTWKRQAPEGMSGIFSGKAAAKSGEKEGEIEKRHAEIGQLVVERDFLTKGERAKAIGSRDPATGR